MKPCARSAGAKSASKVRIRPRVTHLHITPTSNPSVPNCPALNLNNRQEFILPRVSSPNVNATIDLADSRSAAARIRPYVHRSEEHTSELQSQSNLVCRL